MWGAVGRAGLRAFSGGGSPNVGRTLEGKVAVVTAATDGIGLAVAQRLGEAGARVLLSSRRQPNVDAAVQKLRAQGLEVSGVVCHVGQPQDRQHLVQTALDTYGAIDILVSNAAVNPVMGSTLEVEESAWEKIFQVNVTAAAMLVKLVVPHMEKRGGGAVVLVTSVAGFMPFPLWQNEATKEQLMSSMGIDRLGTPSDVAEVVAFLCSPAASYVVGETMVVAGGTPSRL
ncbi:dehydrogenase/reductase SDR family member 4 isoform X2 [Gallus gallus]|uniref:dehydrogenase/reductase SDR family member 4 isoform X2 n=1 Tax=Gallus gallus TaxID=9031 RepID=UPI001EFFAB48|nr:dehydrogenase/reductase SDR family member 4 isoform X2 [Gallus gallus]XP_046798619.1 dehydrogenase/reductase SDR family member 4 isoform X2 [Gallus gallus]